MPCCLVIRSFESRGQEWAMSRERCLSVRPCINLYLEEYGVLRVLSSPSFPFVDKHQVLVFTLEWDGARPIGEQL